MSHNQLIKNGEIISAENIYNTFFERIKEYITICESNIDSLNSFINNNEQIEVDIYARNDFFKNALQQLKSLENSSRNWVDNNNLKPRHLHSDNTSAITGRVVKSDFISARHFSHYVESLYQVVSNIRNMWIAIGDNVWQGDASSDIPTLIPFNDFILENPSNSAYSLTTHKFPQDLQKNLEQYQNKNEEGNKEQTSRNVDLETTDNLPNSIENSKSVVLNHYYDTLDDFGNPNSRNASPEPVRRFLDFKINFPIFEKSEIEKLYYTTDIIYDEGEEEEFDEETEFFCSWCFNNDVEKDDEECSFCTSTFKAGLFSRIDKSEYKPSQKKHELENIPKMHYERDDISEISSLIKSYYNPSNNEKSGSIFSSYNYKNDNKRFLCTASVVNSLFDTLTEIFKKIQTDLLGMYFLEGGDGGREITAFPIGSNGEIGYPYPLATYMLINGSTHEKRFSAMSNVSGYESPTDGNYKGFVGTLQFNKYGSTDNNEPVPRGGWSSDISVPSNSTPPMPYLCGGGNKDKTNYYTFYNVKKNDDDDDDDDYTIILDKNNNKFNRICWKVPPRINEEGDGFINTFKTWPEDNSPFIEGKIDSYYLMSTSIGTIVNGLNTEKDNSVEISGIYALRYDQLYNNTTNGININFQVYNTEEGELFTNKSDITSFSYTLQGWTQINETAPTHDSRIIMHKKIGNNITAINDYLYYRWNNNWGHNQITNTITTTSANITSTTKLQHGKHIKDNELVKAIYGESEKYADYYGYISGNNYPPYPTTDGGKYMYENTRNGKAISNKYMQELLSISFPGAGNKYFFGAFATFFSETVKYGKQNNSNFNNSAVRYDWEFERKGDKGVAQAYHVYTGINDIKINDNPMKLIPRPSEITSISSDIISGNYLLTFEIKDYWWDKCERVELYKENNFITAYTLNTNDTEIVIDISNIFGSEVNYSDEILIKAFNNYGGFVTQKLTTFIPEDTPILNNISASSLLKNNKKTDITFNVRTLYGYDITAISATINDNAITPTLITSSSNDSVKIDEHKYEYTPSGISNNTAHIFKISAWDIQNTMVSSSLKMDISEPTEKTYTISFQNNSELITWKNTSQNIQEVQNKEYVLTADNNGTTISATPNKIVTATVVLSVTPDNNVETHTYFQDGYRGKSRYDIPSAVWTTVISKTKNNTVTSTKTFAEVKATNNSKVKYRTASYSKNGTGTGSSNLSSIQFKYNSYN